MMPKKEPQKRIPLPRGWPKMVKSAVLHVISLGQFTMAYTRGWAADSPNTRVRQKSEIDRLKSELSLVREEMRIKDARMRQVNSHNRPKYPPTERMAILEMKTARNWSLEQA